MARAENVRVHGKSYALETLTANDKLLIVDDVSGGRHTRAVVEQLKKVLNMPAEVRVARYGSMQRTIRRILIIICMRQIVGLCCPMN